MLGQMDIIGLEVEQMESIFDRQIEDKTEVLRSIEAIKGAIAEKTEDTRAEVEENKAFLLQILVENKDSNFDRQKRTCQPNQEVALLSDYLSAEAANESDLYPAIKYLPSDI